MEYPVDEESPQFSITVAALCEAQLLKTSVEKTQSLEEKGHIYYSVHLVVILLVNNAFH